ncbi:FAD-binding oxidoreductase [Ramlibacter sp. G-1-2-2]|uniref:FAD-binding oxidoreductase n=1 Tax=Ramlibacter agri TaxID=2728837 RepID=A0A848H6A0_9BURK|nr:FAD-binding oxidoreductase [Ramlibacter agri]NML44820.1 FAD-binding oxidoreductase [Ramlibacter agri]
MTGLLDGLRRIVGESYCLTEAEAMERYLVEERRLFRGNAIAVARPADTQQVAQVVALCAQLRVPVVPQGGNTGACGGGVPQAGAVVLATERLNRIRAIDTANFTMTVEAGCILADLQQAARDAGCFFPLSLGGEGSCRIGGNLSTNAGGINVLRYGNARDLMLGLEVVLPDGRIWDGLRSLRKDNTGYALRHLFVGAEGTLGIITAASLKLFPAPRERQTAFVAVTDPQAALELLNLTREITGDAANAFELLPRNGLDIGLRNMGGRDPLGERHAWYVLLELSSPRASGLRAALEEVLETALARGLVLDAAIADSETQRRELWRLREVTAGGHQHQEGGLIKHDIAVPVSQVPEMIRRGTAACEAAIPGIRVIPFGHMGDGNLHFNLVQPLGWEPQRFFAERERMNRIVHDLVHELDGSISAEHGIGLLKVDEMARYKAPLELELMQRIKEALDPLGLMNPGKVLPPPAQQR